MPRKMKSKDLRGEAVHHSQVLLQWPHLRPLLPAADLALDVRVPSQVLTIRNFWTAKLCREYVSFLSTLPLVTTPGKPKRGDAVRVNDRYQINDAAFAERLWNETALKELVCGVTKDEDASVVDGMEEMEGVSRELWGGQPIGLNPNIRVYRYSKGQYFDKHYDDANNVIIPGNPPTPAKTTWTLLIYLTSPATGCLGGETVFYPPSAKNRKGPSPDPVVIELEVGLALLHRHGAQCMLHEGREVLQGEKWVIRSDLCVRS